MASNDNIGDQIRDAVQKAIENQDYSSLKETVQTSLGAAAESIKKGLEQAQDAARASQADIQRHRSEFLKRQQAEELMRQQKAIVRSRFAKTGGKQAGGIAMAVVGGIGTAGFFGSAATAALGTYYAGGISAAVLGANVGILAVLGIGCLVLLSAGIRKASLANRLSSYRTIIDSREFFDISELARLTGRNQDAVRRDIARMISKGMIPQGHLSIDGNILMVTDNAWNHYMSSVREQEKREKEEQLRRKEQLAKKAAPPPTGKATLTPEQGSLLEMGNAYIAKIRSANSAISDPVVTAKIDQIELIVGRIFQHAREHPEVIDDLERLMDYYLPMTVKLLDAYADLNQEPIQGENIATSKREIEETLDTLAVAFEKLLDSIFRDMAWDVSSDISVLHAVLAQEGLVGGAFDSQKSANSIASNIAGNTASNTANSTKR